MSLEASLSIAASGLANVDSRFAVVSQNVSNAGTTGYLREVSTQTAVSAGGVGMGVHTGPTGRALDAAVQASLFQQNGVVAGLQTTQAALQGIDAVQGTPGEGTDLASVLGQLQDAFSTLQGSPDNATQQSAVVNAAASVARQVNTISNAVTGARQTAQDSIVATVAALNATLSNIGTLSQKIISARADAQSTADLENQRDAQVASLGRLMSVQTLQQPNGDLLVQTTSGLNLPTRSSTLPFATTGANLAPGASYPGGGVPAITLGGIDVTTRISGGTLGANIALRDTTLPTYQGELDEFAETLSNRFSAQGLTLFTDASGAVPPAGGTPVQAGYVGYAGTIQVNPAVAASPSLVRDGTQAVAGSGTGATAFTPNPPGGPAGFTAMATRVLDFALGSQVQTGVAQPAPATAGLGPAGTLAAPFAPPADLAGFATAIIGAEAQDSGAATDALGHQTAVHTALSSSLASSSGVNMDTEMTNMIQLQSSYAANAKLISAVQAMWAALQQMVA